jgi:hypothetical protein
MAGATAETRTVLETATTAIATDARTQTRLLTSVACCQSVGDARALIHERGLRIDEARRERRAIRRWAIARRCIAEHAHAGDARIVAWTRALLARDRDLLEVTRGYEYERGE